MTTGHETAGTSQLAQLMVRVTSRLKTKDLPQYRQTDRSQTRAGLSFAS